MKWKASIRSRLTLYVLIAAMLPTIVLFVFIFRSNTLFYRRQITQATSTSLDRMVLSLNYSLESLEQVMDFILYNKIGWENDIQTICRQEDGPDKPDAPQRLAYSRIFEYTSSQASYNNSYVESVYLATHSLYNYSYSKSYQSELTTEQLRAEWLRMQRRNSPYLSVSLLRKESGTYVLLSKNVVNTDTGKVIGMLTLVCNTDLFTAMADGQSPWSSTCILDAEGQTLFGRVLPALNSAALRHIVQAGSGFYPEQAAAARLVFRPLPKTEWFVVSQISMESFYRLYSHNLTYLAVVAGLCIVGTLLISVLFSRSFTRPIVRLSQIMSTTLPNRLAVPPRYLERDDEVGSLYRRFGTMVDKINQLIQERYLREIELLHSRMKNLVSQINSHFLFNTLETINCVAEVEEIESVAVMSKSLGDMLRYSIDYEEDEVPLERELQHIKQYLAIQQVRFGKQVLLETHIPPALMQCRVLKFMLQPLVENAVEHGFYGCAHDWRLTISARQQPDALCVEVQDNGKGIDPARMEEIVRRLNAPDTPPAPRQTDERHFSVGLLNIHRRIQLLYSPRYGLQLAPAADGGTIVRAVLPPSARTAGTAE